MRPLFRWLAVLPLAFISAICTAQPPALPKIGFADVPYIYSHLPDAKAIEKELQSAQTQLSNQINAKSAELDSKYKAYVAAEATMLEAVRNNTIRELEMLKQNLDQLKQDAQTTLQKKHEQLMQPVIKKIGKGIEDTAIENEYLVIFSSQVAGEDVILFGDKRIDVSDLILKKLGVTLPAKPQPSGN